MNVRPLSRLAAILACLSLTEAASAQWNASQYGNRQIYPGTPATTTGVPGAVYQGSPALGYPQPYFLRNQPGAGFYNANPYYPAYPVYGGPVFGAPVPIGGGAFNISRGGVQYNFWRAPSGYYYPWFRPAGYGYLNQVIVVQQGVSQPAQPPLSTVFSDLRKFIDESKANGKLADADYEHLSRRLSDLSGKEGSLINSGGGTLDPDAEADLRRDLDQLGAEVSQRVKP